MEGCNMIKKIKKVVVCIVAGATLVGVGAVTAQALPLRNNTHIDLNGVATRPIIGNIRGQGFVETRNANSNGIRVRVIVRSEHANGSLAGNNTSSWQENVVGSGRTLPRWTQAHVGRHTGTTRRGHVRIQGERRAAITGGWNSQLTYDRSWN